MAPKPTATPDAGRDARPPRRESPDARRVVVLQLAFIGDMVFTTAMLDALREHWPGARITVVGRPVALEVLDEHPAVDDVVPYDKQRADRGLRGLLRVARAIRARRPEVLFGVSRSARTTALAALSGAPLRIGFDGPGQRLVYGRTVPRADADRTFVERPLGLLAAAGIEPRPRPARLVVGDRRRAQARARLAAAGWDGRPLVAIAPGANYATKRWPERHVATLLDGLLAGGRLRPALYGGPAERELIARLSAARPGVLDRGDLGLADAMAEISIASVFVGGDTGPLQIARALGVPAVLLAGPTDPSRLSDGRPLEVLTLGLDCQPCSAGGDDRCPLGHHRCLEDLAPDRVLEAVVRVAESR
ncbi:MAG: glycosyltransferase family 9 protein [Acidobacteria bacterium]|nr:MAG: glycosyltransferase family 9 protein [Acidobacteriota bacterium]